MPSSAQKAYNKAHGLPGNWTPPQFLGPANPALPMARTPLGAKVRHQGFKGAKKPEYLHGIRARVILSRVDEIWREVRTYLADVNPYKIHPAHVAKVRTLSDSLPGIVIEPSIWWSDAHGFYLGGVYLPERGGISVAVWYKPQSQALPPFNWEALLSHEMQHLALHWAGANMWLPDGYAETQKDMIP